ncbi:MAG: hypothetical protein ACK5N8_05330 [Alphaproteobacteria bacterium]
MKKEVDLLNLHQWFSVMNSLDRSIEGIPEDTAKKYIELRDALEEDFISCLKNEVEVIYFDNMVASILITYPRIFSEKNNLIIVNYFAEKDKLTSDDVALFFKNFTQYFKNLPKNEEEKALSCLEKFVEKTKNCMIGLGMSALSEIYQKYPTLKFPEKFKKKL